MNHDSRNLLKNQTRNKNILESELGFLEGTWIGSGKIENFKVRSLLDIAWKGQFLVWSSKSVSDELEYYQNSPSVQIPDWKLEKSELIVFQAISEKKIIHMHIRDKDKWNPKNLKFKEIFLRLSLKKVEDKYFFKPVEKEKFQKKFFIKITASSKKVIFENSNGVHLTYFRDEKA